MLTDLSVKKFLDKLANPQPIPGGGSAVALSASLSLSLALMVAGIIRKRSQAKKSRERLKASINNLERLNRRIFNLIDLDAKAYGEVARLGKEKPREKRILNEALKKAFGVQLALASDLVLARREIGPLNKMARGAIKNDLLLSSALLKASFYGAYQTAKINLVYMQDKKLKGSLFKKLKSLVS